MDAMEARRVDTSEGSLGAWVFGATASLIDLCVINECVRSQEDINAVRLGWFARHRRDLAALRRAEQIGGQFSDEVMADRVDMAFEPIERSWSAQDVVLFLGLNTRGYVTTDIDLNNSAEVGRAIRLALDLVGTDLFDALTIAGIERNPDVRAASSAVLSAMQGAATVVGGQQHFVQNAWAGWRVACLPTYLRPEALATDEVKAKLRLVHDLYADVFEKLSGD